MIDMLDALPALTARWLSPLENVDPELHAELAGSIIVTAPGRAPGRVFPAGVGVVLTTLDLADKEIGAFRFAPPTDDETDEGTPETRIAGYDHWMRTRFDAPDDLVFIGSYGPGALFAAPQGIGLFDMEHGRIAILAPDFIRFLLVQANAYDACKRHMTRTSDLAAYEAARDRVAANPRLADADVAAIFAIQRSG